MNWLSAWWQQIKGHAPPDPWETDHAILDARQDQHQRIDKATRLLAADGLALRKERQFWEKHGGRPTKQHDDG